MTVRVVEWSTGNVGRHAIAGIAARDDLELVGVYVSNPDKVGRDAGRLAGLGRELGVVATDDDAHSWPCNRTASSTPRWPTTGRSRRWPTSSASCGPGSTWSPRDRCSCSSPSPATRWPPRWSRRARRGSLDLRQRHRPGFANDTLPLARPASAEQIDEVRCVEVLNSRPTTSPWCSSTSWGSPGRWTRRPSSSSPACPSWPGAAWSASSAGFELELDGIEEWTSRAPPVDLVVDAGRSPAGTMAGLHFEVRGIVGAARAGARARDQAGRRPGPGVAATGRAGVHRVVVTGEPPYTLDFSCSGATATTTPVGSRRRPCGLVNARPDVVAGAPGLLTAARPARSPGGGWPADPGAGPVRCAGTGPGRPGAL